MPAYLLEPTTPAATVPDYSGAIANITSELNDIDTDTTSMAAQILLIVTSLATMATNSTTIAEKLTAIETYHKRMKELGETTGIHMIGPYEKFGLISIYKLLIEEAKILEIDKVSDDKRNEAYRTLQYYFDQIGKVVPKEF